MSQHEKDSVQPQANAGELSENELEAVAGGGIIDDATAAVAGAICTALAVIVEAASD